MKMGGLNSEPAWILVV